MPLQPFSVALYPSFPLIFTVSGVINGWVVGLKGSLVCRAGPHAAFNAVAFGGSFRQITQSERPGP
jgi:hypothetical protein